MMWGYMAFGVIIGMVLCYSIMYLIAERRTRINTKEKRQMHHVGRKPL